MQNENVGSKSSKIREVSFFYGWLFFTLMNVRLWKHETHPRLMLQRLKPARLKFTVSPNSQLLCWGLT